MKLRTNTLCPTCAWEMAARETSCPRCGRSLPSTVYAFTPWWARLLATWIDMLLILVPVVTLEKLISPSFYEVGPGAWLAVGILYAYFVIMEATFGTTVGKMPFGARVLKLDEQPIGWWRSLVRNFFKMPGLWLSLITLLFILISRNSQRLGDMSAGTIVVKDVTARMRQHETPPPAPLDTYGTAPSRPPASPPIDVSARLGSTVTSSPPGAFCTSCGKQVDPAVDALCRACGRPVVIA